MADSTRAGRQYGRRLGCVHLHLNDIQTLINTLNEHADSVTLETYGVDPGSKELTEVDDLRQRRSLELRRLNLVTHNPSILVELHARRPRVSTVERTKSARELVELTSDLVRNGNRQWTVLTRRFFEAFGVTVLLLVCLLGITAAVRWLSRQFRDTPAEAPLLHLAAVDYALFAALWLLVIPLLVGVIRLTHVNHYGTIWITPEERQDRRRVWQHVGVAVTAGLVGAVATLVSTLVIVIGS